MSELRFDRVDAIAGIAVTSLGVLTASISMTYSMGSLASIGPGVFPLALGVLLILFGIGILLGARRSTGPLPPVNLRAVVFVGAAMLAFALMMAPFGLVPAVLACVAISRLAEPGFRPLTVLLLGSALCVMCWGVFVYALGLPIPVLRWPF